MRVLAQQSRRAHNANRSGLPSSTGEIVALVALSLSYVLAMTAVNESSYVIPNTAGPIALSGILAHGTWRAIRNEKDALWTPLVWFRLSTITYFCLGTLAVVIVDPLGQSYLQAFFFFYDRDVLKLNLIVAVSVALTITAARWAVFVATRMGLAQQRPSLRHGAGDDSRRLVTAAILFLLIGLTVEVTVKAPYDFGWSTFEVPGSIMNLTRLTFVGIFLITVWGLRHAKWSMPLVTATVLLYLTLQLLMFNKLAIVLPLAMFLLAFVWTKPSLNRMLVCASIIGAVFAILHPVISEARAELERRYQDVPEAGVMERAEIITSAFGAAPWFAASASGSSALTRLSYVNSATLVINQYDAGQPGDWPKLLPAVFVPRVLWPDKPIITDIARDINELGTGRRTSQAGAGLFADAYWAMGWWGVLLFMPIYGVIVGILGVAATRITREGRWLFFPVALMGVQIGHRTDGHYLADVAGGTVILAGSFVALYIIQRVLSALSLSGFATDQRRLPAPAALSRFVREQSREGSVR